jgi:hypothetical protein
METVEVNIFKFNELSEAAKEKARDWWRTDIDFAWSDESLGSIKAFCEHFGASLTSWSVGVCSPYEFATDATNANFRGLKVADIDRDQMPTGYCLDCTLWFTMHDEFKRTGDAKAAFVEALDQAFREWRSDMESQMEDDYIDENLEINEYTFTEDGTRWN